MRRKRTAFVPPVVRGMATLGVAVIPVIANTACSSSNCLCVADAGFARVGDAAADQTPDAPPDVGAPEVVGVADIGFADVRDGPVDAGDGAGE